MWLEPLAGDPAPFMWPTIPICSCQETTLRGPLVPTVSGLLTLASFHCKAIKFLLSLSLRILLSLRSIHLSECGLSPTPRNSFVFKELMSSLKKTLEMSHKALSTSLKQGRKGTFDLTLHTRH